MLEIPPRFAGRRPVHPDIDKDLNTWSGAQGLAADVEAYGKWMRDEAERQIGYLYPDVIGSDDEKLTPIAWIWARTVESPDPAWKGHVPLVASWVLRNKAGQPKVWIEPIIDKETQAISYRVREGGEPAYKRTVVRGNGTCIATGAVMSADYLRKEARSGRMGVHLMAVVVEGSSGKTYCDVSNDEKLASLVKMPVDVPFQQLDLYPRSISIHLYGLDYWYKLFTPRQLVALTTFSNLLEKVRIMIEEHAQTAGLSKDGIRFRDGGSGSTAYTDAMVTYLAFIIDRCTAYWSSATVWENSGGIIANTFGRQAIPMVWDYSEANPFSSSSGNWLGQVVWVCKAIRHLPANGEGEAVQRDARSLVRERPHVVVSTDPPYYDNVGYANLSDFFYVWLRRNLSDVWPDEHSTILTPKKDEMIANRYRAGSKRAAEVHFESGMAQFMQEVRRSQIGDAPATVYYAYKAIETKEGEVRSTGWATFLQAIVDAGLQVTATWPLRTERRGRMNEIGVNALSSSTLLVCRPRPDSAPLSTRGQFMGALRKELPEALRVLQQGNIAPVDLAQSTIGPGIKVFSRYAKVVEADGSAMSVSDALALINDELGEILDGSEAELDADTRFAVTWYTQHGYESGPAGDADNLARAKNTSLAGIESSGIGRARAGSFRIYRRGELASDWSPVDDDRLTVWEATQYLVAALNRSEQEAAELLHQLGGYGERARQLAYVLFKKASEARWADEAGAYNELINAWPILQSTTLHDDSQQQLL